MHFPDDIMSILIHQVVLVIMTEVPPFDDMTTLISDDDRSRKLSRSIFSHGSVQILLTVVASTESASRWYHLHHRNARHRLPRALPALTV